MIALKLTGAILEEELHPFSVIGPLSGVSFIKKGGIEVGTTNITNLYTF